MIIREPLVNATYYYLREAPGDSPASRQERHEAFVADVHHILHLLAGWLAISDPVLPVVPAWEADPPSDVQPLAAASQLQGRTNASAVISACALRNMLLLRVVISRTGEHDQGVWSMLSEAMGDAPTTPSWLHTVHYWCGVAPRPPEDLEQDRSLPIKASFGVLCLGHATAPHLLVYPDARTEARAHSFLRSLAMRLDWYPVQARRLLDAYIDRASDAARNQQQALDQVTRMAQVPGEQSHSRALVPFQVELDALQTTYADVLADLSTTQSAARDIQRLVSEYRSTLMQSGLWDAAPTVWEARVADLAGMQAQIETDVHYVETTLRRMELLIRVLQTRTAMLQSERQRLLIHVVALIGLLILAVVVADTSLTRIAIRLVALVVAGGLLWGGWLVWLRRRIP
ncbi:MAG TPA: hypothetical protein VMT24_14480 [Aggregatilineaceae bacterium]|nr:hypothetical protein [Aggregatilineaceae bacterium]